MVQFFPDKNINSEESDWLATLFDVGGILGNNDMLSFHHFHLLLVPQNPYYMWCNHPHPSFHTVSYIYYVCV